MYIYILYIIMIKSKLKKKRGKCVRCIPSGSATITGREIIIGLISSLKKL